MSVYYNLKLDSTVFDFEDRRIEWDNFLTKKTIESLEDYSVGVKRFKIPVANVPFYRIYQNRLAIGYYSSVGKYDRNTTTAGNIEDVGVATNIAVDVFGDYAISASHPFNYFSSGVRNKYYLDNRFDDPVLSDSGDSQRTGYYIPVRDNDDYCNILTRALNHSIVNGLDNNQVAAASSTSNERLIAGTLQSFNVNGSGIEADWGAICVLPALGADNNSGIADWVVSITDYEMTDYMKFSDLQFRLKIALGGGHFLFVELGGGYYAGADDIKTAGELNPLKDATSVLRGQGVLSWGAFARLSSDYAKGNPTKSGFTDNLDVRVYPQSNQDLFNLLYRNLSQASISLEVRTTRYIDKTGKPPNNELMFKIAGSIKVVENTEIHRLMRQNNSAYKSQLQAAPCFKWNDTLQKIEIIAMLHQYSSTGAVASNADLNASSLDTKASLFFNNRLFNSLGFKRGAKIEDKRTYANMFRLTTNNQIFHAGVDGGYVVDLSNGQEDFNDTDGNSYIEGGDKNLLIIPNENGVLGTIDYRLWREAENSVFKRNFLYGIEVLTNRIAIEGEAVGDGNSRRKILTDFEIDPSTNFRDYLVYQPQGNSVRYYPINSSGKLEALDIAVDYVDTNGNRRPLTLPLGMNASIKLEFRPNNMIYNYSN